MSSLPHFHFMLSSPHHNQYGFIMLGNEKVHHIEDESEFYKAMGYNDEIRKAGLLPDEYIWNEYHKDKSKKSDVCLQIKIIKYLNKHSSSFKNNYAIEYQHLLDVCNEKRANKSTECEGCILDKK